MAETRSSMAGRLARFAVRSLVHRYYPRLEITGAERIPQTGPVLICANHANSLVDPVFIGITARRPVRFMAKAPLFDVPVLGPVMYALGMVPAFRGSDDARQVRRNLESLDTVAQILIDGDAAGVFPEGKSHDEARVEMVRSGAARIAVQAAEGGAKGVQVVPVGINYESKEDFRSSVWVQVGEPIDVDNWLAEHGGESRPAMRAMTPELESRLKSVVVHLDEPQWEPFLHDLEVLVPVRRGGLASKAEPVRQRKRIADAMNHFRQSDRPRADSVAEAITTYRDQVHAAGLRVDSPILRRRGLPMVLTLLWQFIWLVLLFVPALLGTLFHVVPFTLVRASAAKVRTPGRTTVSMYRLFFGVPVYLLWYAATGWWAYDAFTTWFATTCLVCMPFLGILALYYWRGSREIAFLWWHQIRFAFRRRCLNELRDKQAQLQRVLTEVAEEYERVSPRPEPPPKPARWPVVRRAASRTLVVLAIAAAAWFTIPWLLDRPLIAPQSGPDLTSVPQKQLRLQLDSDEKSLRDIIRGLDDLETRATSVQADFAAGRRSYDNEADNDAVRQLLLSYLNYRAALLRAIWKYQRHANVTDERLRLRAFLLDFTAASVLYETSLKFVRQFNRSEETVARFNEAEPIWNIPPGLYDRIEANLTSRASIRLLDSARQYYRSIHDRLEANRLGENSDYQPFHAAIADSEATIERLGGHLWQRKTVVAAKDLGRLLRQIQYQTQSVVSTWIGDVKIREPRHGRALIRAEHLAHLHEKLQPGDILLERRNWFLSNAFLPGYWPHAALYVGTADDLRRLGLDSDPRVRPFLDEFSQADEAGHPHVIVEALSEGVIFASLEHSIGGADSAAVLRPNLSEDQIKEAIARAFSHATKPYDFEFDFTSRDKLVCTEVVFRAYGANSGPIRFPLKKILGRETMPAIELVRKFKEENQTGDAQLQFIAFVDGDEDTGECRVCDDAAAFVQTLDRPALTFLQGFEEQPAKKLSPLGWTLLTLTLVFTIGNLVYHFRRHAARRSRVGA